MFNLIEINGFRSCHAVTLDDLGKVTALIGRNAAGKSNILQGVQLVARLATVSGPDSSTWRDVPGIFETLDQDNDLNPSFHADVTLAGNRYLYSANASVLVRREKDGFKAVHRFAEDLLETGLGGNYARPVFRRVGEQILFGPDRAPVGIGAGVAAMPALASLLPTDDPILLVTEPLRRFLARVQYYPLNEPAEHAPGSLIEARIYRAWLADYNASERLEGDVAVQILHLALTDVERFTDLKDRLGEKGLGLIDAITVEELGPEGTAGSPFGYMVQFHLPPSAGGKVFSFPSLSQGTRRIVRLVTALSYQQAPVLLVEHPEDGIHKGLVRRVAGLFTTGASAGQVILSTHSDTMMNSLPAESIRFVSMEDGRTTVRKLTQDELSAASDYIASDVDGTLSEFLHSVEG